MANTIGQFSSLKITVSNKGGRIQPATTATVKNQIQEVRSIEDLADVSEVAIETGATLIYNSSNDKYEIRKLAAEDITGEIDLDGGEF